MSVRVVKEHGTSFLIGDFNTTLVSVRVKGDFKGGIGSIYFNTTLVSVRGKQDNNAPTPVVFQYNSCVGSSVANLTEVVGFSDFNTTLVSVRVFSLKFYC